MRLPKPRRLTDAEVQREINWILDREPGSRMYMKNLYDGRHGAFFVRDRSMFGTHIVYIRHEGQHLKFEGVEAMVREGWVID